MGYSGWLWLCFRVCTAVWTQRTCLWPWICPVCISDGYSSTMTHGLFLILYVPIGVTLNWAFPLSEAESLTYPVLTQPLTVWSVCAWLWMAIIPAPWPGNLGHCGLYFQLEPQPPHFLLLLSNSPTYIFPLCSSFLTKMMDLCWSSLQATLKIGMLVLELAVISLTRNNISLLDAIVNIMILYIFHFPLQLFVLCFVTPARLEDVFVRTPYSVLYI